MADDGTMADSPGVNNNGAVRVSIKVDGETLTTLPIVRLIVRSALPKPTMF
jgi:hypothetical protein